ncbi:MAG TPA: hypothetical protein VGY53_04015 [Isosphaeraceae bacterium]|jgi:hypothetical protein|nr:hypothetical protein [Isosphaeraceae bacterium]
MLPEQHRLSPAERANLVAYIDGELNDAESRAIATKLTQSVTARRELEALEKTWELLDFLPRPEPTAGFTERTLSQVQLHVEREGRFLNLADAAAQRVIRVAVLVVSSLATLALCYVAARWIWPDPTARLERNLSVADHLDQYLDIGSYDFLSRLDQSPEFSDEVGRGASAGDEGAPQSLKELSLEGRLYLAKNLERFDSLAPAERARVLELDAQLAKLPGDDRSRLETLLRQYHLWLLGLPEKKRRLLDAATEADRLALIGRFRAQAAASKVGQAPNRRAELALTASLPLFEQGHILQIWFALSHDEQAAILKLPRDEMRAALVARGKNLGLPAIKRPSMVQIENAAPKFKKHIEKLRKEKKEVIARRLEDARWLLEHETDPVDPKKLEQFEAAFPPWLRLQTDPFPPEVARRRLSALYRMVFPEGTEMPDPAAPARNPSSGNPQVPPAASSPPDGPEAL